MAVEVIIRGQNQSGGATSEAAQGIRDVGEAAGQSEGKVKGFFSFLGGAAAGGALAVGGALVGAAGAGLGFNNSMEQARARINAFTKDAGATEQVLDMVAQRAAKTPFAFEEMALAAAALGPVAKSSGVDLEKLIEQAEILAASNPAEGLEGAAFALKEAVSGDFTSAIERFNLSRSYINDLREQGVPDLEALSMAMQQAGYDTDLVSQLAQTAEGRWSTFKDTWTTLAGQVTQPIFDAVSQGLGNANTKLTEIMPQLQAMAQGLANIISEVINSESPLATLGAKIQELGGRLVAWVQESLPGWIAGLGEMGRALVQWVADAAPGLLTQLLDARTRLVAWVLESLPGWASQLAQLGAKLIQWVTGALPGLGTKLGEVAALLISKTGEFIATTAPKLLELAGRFVMWIAEEVLPKLPGTLANIGRALVEGIGNFLTVISPEIIKLANMFIDWVQNEVLPKAPGKLAEIGSAIVTGIAGFLESVGAEAAKVGEAIIDGIASAITSGADAIADAARDAASAAFEAAKKLLGISSPSKVFAQGIGLPIAQGMALGISQGTPLVAEAAGQTAGGAVSAAQQATQRGIGTLNMTVNAPAGARPDQVAGMAVSQLQRALDMRR